MDKNQILAYLKKKIPDYNSEKKVNKHILQFSTHVYPFIAKGTLHPFIENLVNALEEIELKVPGYTKKTVDWIASINKNHFQQVIQIFGEILVLKKLVSVAEPNSITLEPKAKKDDKNPEFRAKVDGISVAIEVKTASLFEFSSERQTGIQITSQLNDLDYEILNNSGKIVNSRSLKIKDYLVSAEEKFNKYIEKEEYKDDIRLLFIIWDDYINEPISALTNPNCGLLTENSFYEESRFENVDGVVVIRHIHQFLRNLLYGEIVNYGIKDRVQRDSFNYINPVVSPIFIQNWFGRNVKDLDKFVFSAFSAYALETYNEIPVAEYQKTDLIDWKRGISFTGIYSLPEKIKNNLISILLQNSTKIPLSYIDIALFDNYSIGDSYMKLLKKYDNEGKIEEILFKRLENFMYIRQFISQEYLNEQRKVIARHILTDIKYWKHFLNLRNLHDSVNCPCHSGKTFGDCCKGKLKFYKYTHYYAL